MNVNYNVLLLLSIFLFSNCKDEKNKSFHILEFEITDSIKVELPFNFPTYSLSMSIYSRNDTNFMLLQNNTRGGKLIEIDISNNIYRKAIDVSNYLRSPYPDPVFFSTHYGIDSILILQTPGNFDFRHDSLLTIVNFSGKIIGVIGIQDDRFLSYRDQRKNKLNDLMYVYQSSSDIEIKNGLVFFKTLKWNINDDCNVMEFIKENTLGGHIKINDINNQFFQHDVKYITTSTHDCDSLRWSVLSYNDSIIFYLFDYSDNVIKYNYLTNKSLQINNKTPKLLEFHKKRSIIDNTNHEFQHSFIFESDGHIFRTAFYPKPRELESQSYKNQKHDNLWIGAFDMDFNLIAENTASDKIRWSYPKPTEFNGELYALKRKQAESHEVVVYKIKPVITEIAHSKVKTLLPEFDFSEQKPKIPLNKYLISQKIPNNSYVLFVPAGSCPSCVNYVLDEYISNFDDYSSRNLYLWVSKGTYDHYISKRLKNDDLEYRTSKYILVSKDEDIGNIELPVDPSNPMIFSIENNRVKQTFLFNPDQLALFDNFEEQFK